MIIAALFGGPHDGQVVAIPELTPLVLPVSLRQIWDLDNDSGPVMTTVTYVPREDTLQVCRCCPGWAHPTAQPSVDLSSITYSQHMTCTYYLSGRRK